MCGRTALALATVVSTRSSLSTDVTRLRNRARRWLVLRPSLNPALRWRIEKLSFVEPTSQNPHVGHPNFNLFQKNFPGAPGLDFETWGSAAGLPSERLVRNFPFRWAVAGPPNPAARLRRRSG